jgi:hypothetical protein
MGDPLELFISFFVSLVGLAFFMYGKKEKRIPQMLGGLALMVYPYFVDGLWLILGIGVLLVGLLVAAVRLGW